MSHTLSSVLGKEVHDKKKDKTKKHITPKKVCTPVQVVSPTVCSPQFSSPRRSPRLAAKEARKSGNVEKKFHRKWPKIQYF